MSYALVYGLNGDEFWEAPLTSIDAVNAEIRKLHDQCDNVTILRIEEGHDGPRTWQIEYPPAPPAGTRVINGANVPFVVGEGGRVECEGMSWAWHEALKKYGPLTEVVETEVEAAARWLRERGYDRPDSTVPASTAKDIRTVLDHVLSGGQL